MHYRLIEPRDSYAAEIFREVREGLSQNAQMKQDRERLSGSNGVVNKQVVPYFERLLCAGSVFFVSLWWRFFSKVIHHKDTENTEVAQRNPN